MKFIRESQVEEIYQCEFCREFKSVPRGCDLPYCGCGGEETSEIVGSRIEQEKELQALESLGHPNN